MPPPSPRVYQGCGKLSEMLDRMGIAETLGHGFGDLCCKLPCPTLYSKMVDIYMDTALYTALRLCDFESLFIIFYNT